MGISFCKIFSANHFELLVFSQELFGRIENKQSGSTDLCAKLAQNSGHLHEQLGADLRHPPPWSADKQHLVVMHLFYVVVYIEQTDRALIRMLNNVGFCVKCTVQII